MWDVLVMKGGHPKEHFANTLSFLKETFCDVSCISLLSLLLVLL